MRANEVEGGSTKNSLVGGRPILENINFPQSFPPAINALGAFLLGFLGLWLLVKTLRTRLERTAPTSKNLIDDCALELLRATKRIFLLVFALYSASFLIEMPAGTRLLLDRIFTVIFLGQAAFWGNSAITFWIERHLRERSLQNAGLATSLGLIKLTVKFAFYSLIVLLAIHNLGFDITALIAGLGVGGIAIALALQNILGDLFASLSITLDQPFVVGDFIVVGEFKGTIEYIGLKTTRLRSLSGEQLIFANGDLLQSRLRNFKRMLERRVVVSLGLVYQTSGEHLRLVPEMVKEIITKTENARFDRCHFLKFGASSLDFELIYWVTHADFNVYADAAQEINLEIVERFKEVGIEFAYPTQTLFVQQEPN